MGRVECFFNPTYVCESLSFLKKRGSIYFIFSYQLPFHKDWNLVPSKLAEVITLEFGSWTTVRWPLYLREPYYGNIFQQIQTFLGSDKILKKS